MSCFSPAVRDLFDRWGQGEFLKSLEASHQQLLERRIDTVEFGNPQTLTPEKRAAANCRLLQQALLHRAERLLASSGTMLLENNVYGLALIARGHCETTAVLGHFCSRLESLAAGRISFDDFQWNIADAVMGAKHHQFTAARHPVNILTCIEKSDKYLDKYFFKEKRGMLQDCYDWLSEFSHPNFLSNISAFTLDRPNNRFVLQHGHGHPRQEDFQLPGYLDLSAALFVYLFDEFTRRADESALLG